MVVSAVDNSVLGISFYPLGFSAGLKSHDI